MRIKLFQISEVTAIQIQEYLRNTIAEKKSLMPLKATNVKVTKLRRIVPASNCIYFFSFSFLCNSNITELDFVLKIREATETKRKICKKEYSILKYLRSANFSVPAVHVLELDESFLGGPFIIMEQVKGISLKNFISHGTKVEINSILKKFAGAFARLHNLEVDPSLISVDFPENAYSYAKGCASIKDEVDYAKDWDYEWITDWLRANAVRFPSTRYSLVHFDAKLDNYVIVDDELPFFVDWEWSHIGDGLRDICCAYFEIMHILGESDALRFINYYLGACKEKIDYSKVRFYLVVAGLYLALNLRFLGSNKGSNTLINIFGKKSALFFPFIRWHFRRRAKRLEKYIRKIALDEENITFRNH